MKDHPSGLKNQNPEMKNSRLNYYFLNCQNNYLTFNMVNVFSMYLLPFLTAYLVNHTAE